MKTIGFIDYYLSDWHANHISDWLKQVGETTGLEFKIGYAYGAIDSPKDGMTSEEWCSKFGAEKCDTIQEVAQKSDALMILSPDNSEFHLPFAKEAFPSGKPVFVDKTFANDLETAKEIFNLAEKYNCPIYSSSALRFAEELKPYLKRGGKDIKNMILYGPGEFEIYIIHIIEMAVAVSAQPFKEVCCRMFGALRVFELKADNFATYIIQCFDYPSFRASFDIEGESKTVSIDSNFFIGQITATLNMFESKKVPVAKEETLSTIAIREALIESSKKLGTWIPVKK